MVNRIWCTVLRLEIKPGHLPSLFLLFHWAQPSTPLLVPYLPGLLAHLTLIPGQAPCSSLTSCLCPLMLCWEDVFIAGCTHNCWNRPSVCYCCCSATSAASIRAGGGGVEIISSTRDWWVSWANTNACRDGTTSRTMTASTEKSCSALPRVTLGTDA